MPNLIKKRQLWYIPEPRESFTSRSTEVIIPLAFMASESIAHSAFGFMGYWLRAHSGWGIIVKYQEQIREIRKFHVVVAQQRQRNVHSLASRIRYFALRRSNKLLNSTWPCPFFNREEKSLRHVAMAAKFVDDNKPKHHLKSGFALFQTSSI